MENPISVKIVTPSAEAMELECGYVKLPTPDGGSLGILRHHAPLVCSLGEGTLLCRRADGEELCFRVAPGVAHVAEDRLSVLTAQVEKI